VELVKYLPKEACKISESGIKDAETVSTLRLIGYNGFLIGENFMKKNDPGKALKEFIEKI
jgi:indole-3-glycerol phosphate synthase